MLDGELRENVASNWLAGPDGVPSWRLEPLPLETLMSTVTVAAAGTVLPPQLLLKRAAVDAVFQQVALWLEDQ